MTISANDLLRNLLTSTLRQRCTATMLLFDFLVNLHAAACDSLPT